MRTAHVLSLSIWLIGCGTEHEDELGSARQALSFERHDARSLIGRYDDGVTTLGLVAEHAADVVTIEIAMTRGTLRLVNDLAAGSMQVSGDGIAFTREEIEAFVGLDRALEELSGPEPAPIDALLAGMATQLADAVPGVVWQDVTAVSTRSVVHIGSSNTCRTLYGSCTRYKQTGRNSPNCKGRCGAGCGSARPGGYNRWTMDCAEHDYGIGPWNDCWDDIVAGTSWSQGSGEFCATNCSCRDGC